MDRPIAGAVPDGEATVSVPGQPQVTTTWWEDGKPMTGESFLPGHAYTIVIHVKTEGAAFDTDVYVNEGYTVERTGENELILRRSFYVAQQYTQDISEDELAEMLGSPAESPAPDDTAQTDVTEDKAAEEEQATPGWGKTVIWMAVALVLAAAVLLVQLMRPGGWKTILKQNNNDNKHNTEEGMR